MTKVSVLASEVQILFTTDLKGLVIGILPALCYALYALSTHEMLLPSKIMLSVVYEIYFFRHTEVAEGTNREGERRPYSNLYDTQYTFWTGYLKVGIWTRWASLLDYIISTGTLPTHRYEARWSFKQDIYEQKRKTMTVCIVVYLFKQEKKQRSHRVACLTIQCKP